MANSTVKARPEQELGDRNATREHDARSGFAIPSKRARITDHVDGSRGKKFQSSVGVSNATDANMDDGLTRLSHWSQWLIETD
ncbi:hypothetical protein Hanom_Chr01g00092501 [Helianthus anomalus]